MFRTFSKVFTTRITNSNKQSGRHFSIFNEKQVPELITLKNGIQYPLKDVAKTFKNIEGFAKAHRHTPWVILLHDYCHSRIYNISPALQPLFRDFGLIKLIKRRQNDNDPLVKIDPIVKDIMQLYAEKCPKTSKISFKNPLTDVSFIHKTKIRW